MLVSVNGTNQPAPISGVLVGFNIKMSTPVTGHLRILDNPTGGPVSGTLVYNGVGPDVNVPGDSAVHNFPLRLPITAGDLIAFGTPGNAVARTGFTGSNTRIVGDTVDGSTPGEASLDAATRNALQAPFSGVIEADADNDVFGDETQDQCPGVAGANNGCPNRTLTVTRAGAGTGSVTSGDSQINCGTACTHSYVSGTSVVLTAKAAAGSAFKGWSGGGCTGTGTCTVSLTQDQTVTARFAPAPPSTSITQVVINQGAKRAAFRFRARGKSTGFQCALAKKGRKLRFRTCKSPKSYRNLRSGRYTFAVRAVGPGGRDATPAKRRFRI